MRVLVSLFYVVFLTEKNKCKRTASQKKAELPENKKDCFYVMGDVTMKGIFFTRDTLVSRFFLGPVKTPSESPRMTCPLVFLLRS